MISYTFSKTVGDCVYSIDMLYIRGYLTCSLNSVRTYLDTCCESHKSYKGRSKYSWFQDMYVFDGVTLYVGMFDEFDKIKRTWSTLPLAEVRFNPNKHPNSMWVDYFLSITDSRFIRKYDFACDVPCQSNHIIVKSRRMVSSISDGDCVYYGAFGSDGHLKIYDKEKELLQEQGIKLGNPLTRIEVTLTTNRTDSWITEEFYRIDKFCDDFSQIDGLNDTDIAILNMYMRLCIYEPNTDLSTYKLGRKKEKKIKEILLSSSPSVHLSFSVLLCSELLDLVSVRYECTTKAVNRQLLNDFASVEELPIPKS